jgi:methyl-accepting chemotaxis protein
MSVKTRLVASIAAVIAVALAVLTAVIATLTSDQAQADGERYAASLAKSEATGVGAGISRQMGTALSLSRLLATTVTAQRGDRALADVIERDLLAADPSLLGVWSGFEPNAFDGRDAAYAGTPVPTPRAATCPTGSGTATPSR